MARELGRRPRSPRAGQSESQVVFGGVSTGSAAYEPALDAPGLSGKKRGIAAD